MDRPPQQKSGPDDGDLGRLLAAEERLECLLAEARAEAAQLLADAAAAAAARERGLDAELEKAAAALKARLTGERAIQEAEILAAAKAATGRYDAIAAGRLDTLARAMVDRLLAGGP